MEGMLRRTRGAAQTQARRRLDFMKNLGRVGRSMPDAQFDVHAVRCLYDEE